MTGEVRAFRKRRLSPEEGQAAAARILEVPIGERVGREAELHLDDPETLLPLLDAYRQRWERSPAEVIEEAVFLYRYLEKVRPSYPADLFLLDEREYFLGETSRIAGAVCRQLSRRDEARHWFDLAEGWFLQTENSAGNLAKLSYQKLALRTDERDFAAVGQLLPQLISTFEKYGMSEDALKTRFLKAVVLKETDQLTEAVEEFSKLSNDAGEQRNDSLRAWASVNLFQLYGFLGEPENALRTASNATALLKKTGNRIGSAKLQWGVGYLLRSEGDLENALSAYRVAQNEFAEIGMRADVAAVNLVNADILLELGQDKQAEWEIRQALPIIDENKLVPEGFAALSLLKESLRRQKIDRQALRSLHGYFEELQG
jgi:tetratricopeptide (TPR) repeat protein